MERAQVGILYQRITGEKRRFIQVVIGPRQVGKTTGVQQLIKRLPCPSIYISADAISAQAQVWIEQQWALARLRLKQTQAEELLLVIDEIQKIPQWSEAVKKEWDEDTIHHTPIKVILLGSSRLLIQQGLSESLAGRFETTYMGHWSFAEMRNAFDFTPEEYAWFGAYPGSADLRHDEQRWKMYILDSIIQTTLSKDIFQLTRINKPALLQRLFEIGCRYSGQILSFNKILGQLQDAGNTTTLSHYLQLLSDAALLTGFEKYYTQMVLRRGSSPKFQVQNMALMTASQPEFFEVVKAKPAMWGRWVESVVGTHLLLHSFTHNYEVFYWREGDQEVDFVLRKGDQVLALEVKNQWSSKHSGIQVFKKQFPFAKTFLIADQGLSWQQFLTLNPGDLFNR